MSTREAAIEAVERYFDTGAFREELAARVAVQSSSREDEHGPDLLAYQERLMRPRFEAMGFSVEIHANPVLPRAPFLVAHRIEDPHLPTLFCYGHGDTVPGEEGRWKDGRDPWTLDVAADERWGERWYGRGTADNKGQHAINMEAMRHIIEARGQPRLQRHLPDRDGRGDGLARPARVLLLAEGPAEGRPPDRVGRPAAGRRQAGHEARNARGDELPPAARVPRRRPSFRQLGRPAGQPGRGADARHHLDHRPRRVRSSCRR